MLDGYPKKISSIQHPSTVSFINRQLRMVFLRENRRRIHMKDGLTESKEREFEEVFGAIMKEFADRDYDNRQVVNALACSICVVAMRSNDPEVFINDISEKMREFVTSSVRSSDLYSRPAPE